MKNFSSLSISILLHIIILLFLFLTYQKIQNVLNDSPKEEKVCIKLNNCITQKEIPKTIKKQQSRSKQIQKKTKIQPKKHHQSKPKQKIKNRKKIIQKVTIPKKQYIQKPKKIQKDKSKQIKKQSVLSTPKQNQPQSTIKPNKTSVKPTTSTIKRNPQPSKAQKKASYTKSYIESNIYKIRELIAQNLYYPRKARRRHIEGKVILKVTISKNGKILHIDTISSDHDVLTHAAKQIFIIIEDQIPKPKETITLTVPISYRLR